jgi:hypothetical protein
MAVAPTGIPHPAATLAGAYLAPRVSGRYPPAPRKNRCSRLRKAAVASSSSLFQCAGVPGSREMSVRIPCFRIVIRR